MPDYDDDADDDNHDDAKDGSREADEETVALNRGFSSGLSKSFEMVLGPVIFGLIGFGVDTIFNTLPIFTIILAVLALIGGWAKVFYDYSRQMKDFEDKMPWND